MFQKILCATDGSEHAEKAAALAGDLAAKYGADLVILHVLMTNASSDDLRRFAEMEGLARDVRPEMDRLVTLQAPMPSTGPSPGSSVGASPRSHGVSTEVLERIGEYALESAASEARARGATTISTRTDRGDPGKCILRCAADEGVDLIVTGSRGLGSLKGLIVGSVSNYVTSRSDCTCITVK